MHAPNLEFQQNFHIMELFHIEYKEPMENTILFLYCEIQVRNLLEACILFSPVDVTTYSPSSSLFWCGLLCFDTFQGHQVTPEVTNQIIDLAQPSIQKWIGDIHLSNLVQCRYLFILMNIGWHWYLLVLDLKEP